MMKRLKVTVDGKVYDVSVELTDEGPGASPGVSIAAPPAPAPAVQVPVAAPVVASAPKPAAAAAGDVTSPLAGKLVSVEVKLGQEVAEGAQVATVEAMKMNTYIYAPKSGKVASIQVNPGEAVDEGSVILRIA